MTATLTTLRTRVQTFLSDAGATAYTTAALDEAIRQALAEYSAVAPRHLDTVLTLPGDGVEVALNALDALIAVTAACWPYDSTLTTQLSPNQVAGFSLAFDDGQPLLTLSLSGTALPGTGDELRLQYTTPQHLDGLDAAAGTTVPLLHESWLVIGAAAYAALQRAGDVTSRHTETARTQANLAEWGLDRLEDFRGRLAQLTASQVQHGQPFSSGWKLDNFDL